MTHRQHQSLRISDVILRSISRSCLAMRSSKSTANACMHDTKFSQFRRASESMFSFGSAMRSSNEMASACIDSTMLSPSQKCLWIESSWPCLAIRFCRR